MIRKMVSEIRALLARPFVRNTLILQMGNVGGTFLQAIAGVFIARILQPELFGIYALAFSMASVASVGLGAGTQEAMASIAGEAHAKGERHLLKDAFAFLMKASIFLGLLVFLITASAPYIAERLYGDASIGSFASIIIFGAIISTVMFSPTSLALQVSRKIRALAVLLLADQGMRYGFSILFLIFGFGIFGAVSGHLAGALVIAFSSMLVWKWAARKDNLLPPLGQLIRHVPFVGIRKYAGFGFRVTLDRNIASLYGSLPILLTGLYVIPAEVTYFKLAFGFLNLALALLAPISILLNVEFPKIKTQRPGELLRTFVRVTGYAVLLSTVITVVVVFISPVLFTLLYGESYSDSIKYIFGLLPFGALFGIGVALGPMWRTLNRVKTSIVINIVTLGIGIPFGMFMISRFSLWGSVAMVTLWYTTSHLVSFLYIFGILRNQRIETSTNAV